MTADHLVDGQQERLDHRLDTYARLHAEGAGDRDIAEELGITLSSLRATLKANSNDPRVGDRPTGHRNMGYNEQTRPLEPSEDTAKAAKLVQRYLEGTEARHILNMIGIPL